MPASTQTFIAFAIVGMAVALLMRSWLKKSPGAGCGQEGCSAVSPEIKKLRDKLKR
jgi:hypothetical protein